MQSSVGLLAVCVLARVRLKHINAQRKTELNSTQLNYSVQYSFALCIEPATTRRQKWAAVAGSLQWGARESASRSLDENGRRLAQLSSVEFSSVFRCTFGFREVFQRSGNF